MAKVAQLPEDFLSLRERKKQTPEAQIILMASFSAINHPYTRVFLSCA